MDQQKLRSLVFEKTGIKIDTSDPVFALVAMNEAVLEEAVQRHLLILEQASKTISRQLHSLQVAGGLAEADQVAMSGQDDIWETSAAQAAQAAQAANASPHHSAPSPSTTEHSAPAEENAAPSAGHSVHPTKSVAQMNPQANPTATTRSLAADLRLAWMTSLFSAVLVLLGLATFGPKVPQISEIAQAAKMQGAASRLTPQQAAQIKQAEKLQTLLPKLDAKARSQIEAELQKP